MFRSDFKFFAPSFKKIRECPILQMHHTNRYPTTCQYALAKLSLYHTENMHHGTCTVAILKSGLAAKLQDVSYCEKILHGS